MKKRVEITMTFSADLDMIPGWGHNPEDWVKFVRQELIRASAYDTKLDISEVKVVPR